MDVPAELAPSWLYNGLADLYSDWLSPSAIATFRENGRYSELVQTGFRIIAVNSNMGVDYNL